MIIINDTAKNLATNDDFPSGWQDGRWNGRLLMKSLMGAAFIVVRQELIQYTSQMSLIHYQYLIEALFTKTAYKSFSISIGIWRFNRRTNDIDAF